VKKVISIIIAGVTLAIAGAASAYDRCHYETRSDSRGTYNVLVCCDENGRCRESRVR
jgi:hypothetical protein